MSTDYRTSIFDEPSPFDIILFSVGGFTGPNCVGMTSNQYKRIWLVNTVSYQMKKKIFVLLHLWDASFLDVWWMLVDAVLIVAMLIPFIQSCNELRVSVSQKYNSKNVTGPVEHWTVDFLVACWLQECLTTLFWFIKNYNSSLLGTTKTRQVSMVFNFVFFKCYWTSDGLLNIKVLC